MLDKRFRADCLKLGMKFNYPVSNRYHTLLRQRHIQVIIAFMPFITHTDCIAAGVVRAFNRVCLLVCLFAL